MNKRKVAKRVVALGIVAGLVIAVSSIDVEKVREEQAIRIQAVELETKKELECALSGGKWKHVNRYGFVCAPTVVVIGP